MMPFLKPRERGTRSTFGLLDDEHLGTLSVTSNDATAVGAPGLTAPDGGWIKAFDLAASTLKLSCGYRAGSPDERRSLDTEGAFYVTDMFPPGS